MDQHMVVSAAEAVEHGEQELPPGWVCTTLGDAFRWSSGGTPRSSNPNYYGGAIPWLVIGDLTDGLAVRCKSTLTEAGLENSSAKWVEPGSILVAMYGASIGKLGIAGIWLTTNQAIASANPGLVDGKYLFYYLLGQRDELIRLGQGAAQNNISQTIIKAYPFMLAPVAEQRRIVAAIETQFTRLDAGVTALKALQAKLKRYRAAVLKAAVEGKLTEEWRAAHPDVEPAGVLLQRILQERRRAWERAELEKYAKVGKTPPKGWQEKYREPAGPDVAELPELPEGWCWASLALVADIHLGKMLSPKAHEAGLQQLPYLRNENVRWGWINISDVKQMGFKVSELERYRVEPGDLMVCEGGEAGRCAVYTGIGQFMYQKALHRVRPIGHFISSQFVQFCIEHYVAAGIVIPKPSETTIQHLTLEKMLILPVPLPPADEQTKIVAEVDRRLSVVAEIEATVEAQLKRAERLRQSILSLAFAGKLVPQDPNDEPAEALLRRIQVERREGPRPHAARDDAPRTAEATPTQLRLM